MVQQKMWCHSLKLYIVPNFFATQFLLLRFSLIDSDKITESNNKKHPTGSLYLWDSYTITSKAL